MAAIVREICYYWVNQHQDELKMIANQSQELSCARPNIGYQNEKPSESPWVINRNNFIDSKTIKVNEIESFIYMNGVLDLHFVNPFSWKIF